MKQELWTSFPPQQKPNNCRALPSIKGLVPKPAIIRLLTSNTLRPERPKISRLLLSFLLFDAKFSKNCVYSTRDGSTNLDGFPPVQRPRLHLIIFCLSNYWKTILELQLVRTFREPGSFENLSSHIHLSIDFFLCQKLGVLRKNMKIWGWLRCTPR